MIGTLVKIKGNRTDVIGIIVKPSDGKGKDPRKTYWRVLGTQNHRWYELSLDNPYIEVLSASR